jgi:putative addiction module killer protein
MREIRRSGEFDKWLKRLRDGRALACILTRIRRLAEGNPGDSRFLGGISELRINYGPGYRISYRDTGREIVILLCGGDKRTQQADIERARLIAAEYNPREEE